MPQGKPDWGVDWAPRTVRGLEDLGEHAVRLGSPHLWDRRGDVIWQTIFAEGLTGVEAVAVGGGASILLHTGRAWQGAYCVKMTVPDLLLRSAVLAKWGPLPITSGLGFEVAFAFDDDMEWFSIAIEGNDGTRQFRAEIRYDHLNGQLLYYDHAGLPQVVETPFLLASGGNYWHIMKMVIRFDLVRYGRVIVDNQEFDLIAHAYRVFGGAGPTYIENEVTFDPDTGDTSVIYVDSMIVTQNEP